MVTGWGFSMDLVSTFAASVTPKCRIGSVSTVVTSGTKANLRSLYRHVRESTHRPAIGNREHDVPYAHDVNQKIEVEIERHFSCSIAVSECVKSRS